MQLNELLSQIDALKAEIDQLRPLKPEVEHRIMQKFRLDWNYHSNAIEGNTLTLGETKAFLMEGLTASGKPLKDHLDIKGHNELIDFLQLFIQRQERLTEAAIREMHKILLREPYEAEAVTLDGRIVKKLIRLGEYKTTPNFVRTGSGQIHQYSAPEDVAPKMADLVEWQREQEQKAVLHPVVQAALFHHRFLAIHPFDDGNGRLGRILMNLLVMRAGFPPAVVKMADRDPYVAALRRADAGELDGITAFIARSVLDSESLYLRGAKGGSIEDTDDVDKAIALLKQELAHVDDTLPLSTTTQLDAMKQSIVPLTERVEAKLKQFDDLFSNRRVKVSWGANIQGRNGMKDLDAGNWTTQLSSIAENAIGREGLLLTVINISFTWSKFRKAHLNAFDLSIPWRIVFQELQFVAENAKDHPKNIRKRYPHTIKQEEMSEFANALAEKGLLEIRQMLDRKEAATK